MAGMCLSTADVSLCPLFECTDPTHVRWPVHTYMLGHFHCCLFAVWKLWMYLYTLWCNGYEYTCRKTDTPAPPPYRKPYIRQIIFYVYWSLCCFCTLHKCEYVRVLECVDSWSYQCISVYLHVADTFVLLSLRWTAQSCINRWSPWSSETLPVYW